jgi:DivIVA domain-containing protein
MPLTPEDVSNKRFTTVRLREGYDMTEVDQFLDEVEAELTRITKENTELRTKLGAGSAGLAEEPATVAAVEPTVETEAPVDASAPAEVAEVVAEPVVAEPTPERVPPLETIQVSTTAEASAAATRLLELAGRNADQLVGEAREEADRIVGQAQSTAETIEAEARGRVEALDNETTERRRTILGQIEEQKAQLDVEIDNLRTFEREYRAELRTYFEEQLAALDGHGAGGVLGRMDRDAVDGVQPRLQELLDEGQPEDGPR